MAMVSGEVPEVGSLCEGPESRVPAYKAKDGGLAEKFLAGGLDPEPCASKIEESLTLYEDFWGFENCERIEAWINETVLRNSLGGFDGQSTVDATALRTKYFFGHGYTYGHGCRGTEKLLHLGAVDPIPLWVRDFVIKPLEDRGIVEPGWIDSVVMNDYRTGSSIVAHVDPPQLFARPILTLTFFGTARLVFGASFDAARRTPPVYSQTLTRGSVLLLDGYAANRVTHGIRPEDLLSPRRVSIVLRHVVGAQPESELKEVVSVPKATQSPWWALVQLTQGLWRDSDSSSDRVYWVHDMVVMVMDSRYSDGAVRNPAVPGAPWTSAWPLLAVGDGLSWNDALLDCGASSSYRLHWRRPRGSGRSKDFTGSVWLRAANLSVPDVASCVPWRDPGALLAGLAPAFA